MILKKIRKDKKVNFFNKNSPNFPKGKRGSEWHYILVSLILGILILVIVLYFFFQEFFNEEEISWETCRQSIVIRNSVSISSTSLFNTFLEASKDITPLKCKTEVVNIQHDEDARLEGKLADKVMKQIANELVKCNYLFGEGQYKIFPVNFLEERYDCVICTRIHFDNELKNNINILPLWEYLVTHDKDGKLLRKEEYNTKSYAKYLEIGGNMPSLLLPGLKNLNEGYGSRGYVDLSKGDLLIGMSFYSNRELGILESVKYQQSRPFYFQPDLDNLKCNIQSVPA